MSFYHLERNKRLQEAGKRLGRTKLANRIISLVEQYNAGEKDTQAAMELAGRIKAICQASKFDDYWFGLVNRGFDKEYKVMTGQKDLFAQENGG